MFSSNTSQVSGDTKYIEDYFSTFLYSGTGAAQTITNGIDLATKGGLVWYKRRSGVGNNVVVDTSRGMTSGSSPLLNTNTTDSQTAINNYVIANTTGFSFGSNATGTDANASGSTYVSWSIAKSPKFFDVVTYTGTGSVQNISHNLGSAPACMIVKDTTNAGSAWAIYHTSLGNTQYLQFTTSAAGTSSGYWNNTSPTSTQFTVGTNGNVNQSGATYVAYLFADNAGGFGLTGTDNVISCGSFTTDSGGSFSVNLGYEPQWVMIKSTNNTGVSAAQQNWIMMDNMRGFVTQSGNGARLRANTSEAESTTNDFGPTATGFESLGNMSASAPFIYIAIRRGPMKVPTSGTSVFALDTLGGTLPNPPGFNAGFPVDLGFFKNKVSAFDWSWGDRLRGANELYSNNTSAEVARSDFKFDYQDGWFNSTGVSSNFQSYNFRRAPSFFDEVCYTGNGASSRAVSHNLGVAPEMMIVIVRNDASLRCVYHSALAPSGSGINLNSNASTTGYEAGFQAPSSSTFTVTTSGSNLNYGPYNYVAYLFASCPGVSKVGSYTGTGTTKQIDCGFTGGARFVLIKKTSGTGSWYVWDSARGIVSGNDPYLLLNSTAAEVTSTDYIDTYSAGFEISSTAPSEINENGGSFIFLAIS